MPERTDHNEAMRLADLFELEPDPESLYRQAAALLRQQAEQIDQLRAEVEQLKLAEEGAAQAFGDVVQQKRDLEAEVKRLQSLLDGAYASIRQHAARTTHKETE